MGSPGPVGVRSYAPGDFDEPLPPVADEGVMRPAASVAVLLLAASISGTALAGGTAKSKNKAPAKKPTLAPATALVASAEPLPPLPAPAPAPAPALSVASSSSEAAPVAKDSPATAVRTGRPSAGPGFVLDFGTGFTGLGGSIAEGLGVGAPLATVSLRLGAYVTRHVGLMAGVQGGYGGLTAGCAGSCTNALAFQIPVVAQYAFEDRSRGVYLEGGVALLTTYAGSTDIEEHPDASPEVIKMSAPFDLKLGIGYRAPTGPSDKASKSGMEIRLGVDVGQFTSLEYSSESVDEKGEIPSEKRAFHVAVGIVVGYQFAP
ncbi:MAG: hypothetical protein JWP97_4366 [Labilithrix sp.]|nr:hypothetical protein [Labilithrix sp.]